MGLTVRSTLFNFPIGCEASDDMRAADGRSAVTVVKTAVSSLEVSAVVAEIGPGHAAQQDTGGW